MKKYFELEMKIVVVESEDIITMSQTNTPSLNEYDDVVGDFFN
jgi:hypothetical protein